jgi:hypothetical protein
MEWRISFSKPEIRLNQRSPTGGPRENFGGPWRNLDIAVTSLEPRIHKLISNKQQQISH